MGRHKKHKKHQSSLTPGVLQDDGVLSELEAGGSGAEQMKVILKLSSSRQKVPKHTKVHPEPVSPPAELVVSISRLYLRPATPTCVGTWEEENMDEIPHLLSSTSSSAEHKSHKSKKHKKHKKHSSHELQSSSVLHASPLHSPIQIRLLGGSGMSHSGKEMTSLVSQHASHTSPFKFTFSREVMTGKLDEGRQPLTMSSPPTVSHHHDKKSHKHKKHHRHHHHHHAAHTSPLESTDLSVVEVSCYNPSLAVRQSVSGKQFNSPPWLGDDDDSERPSAQVSCDSIQDSPSVQDVSGEMSHDNDSQSHDQESEVCVGMPWLTTEPTLSKPHKKKKKKHKHLQHDLSIPIPPLTITPSTSTLQNPSPASPVSHGTPIQPPPQQAYISSGVKRRRESSREEDALMATSHLSKKPHYTSPLLILSPTPPPSVATTPKKDVPSITKPMPPEEANPLPPPSLPPPPYPPSQRPSISPPAVKLSSNALKFFLKNILYLIQKRDPEGIFVEPVTDDIAPGYSAIITNPMDLTTMATKVEANLYPSVKEFKSDFTLMCNNAMTYNTAETVYYVTAKRLLSSGLQIIAKETSLRPDIRLGRVLADNSGFFSSPFPLPSVAPEFNLPHPSNISINYDSAFLCSLPLHKIKPHPPPTQGDISELLRADGFGNLDLEKFGIREVTDQSHLTRVVVGCEEDVLPQDTGIPEMEEMLQQVETAASLAKENLDYNKPEVKYCFVNQNSDGKTMMNILNPDTSRVDFSQPVDLSVLHDRVRMGQNAATVLATELPMMRATPVSYLMYGPFGSFAPVYDSAFATLSKMDSDLLLSSYGSELGVSYAHSLQHFVRGAGGFVSEMATAVLNGLTNNRHSNCMQKLKSFEDKKSSTTGASPIAGGGGGGDEKERAKIENASGGTIATDSNSDSALAGVYHLESSQVVKGEDTCKEKGEMESESTEESSSATVLESNVSTSDEKLMQTSSLLTQLQAQQMERLTLPSYTSKGQLLLPPPTNEEVGVAREVRQKLAALTAMAQPEDVVSVGSLHTAMGVTIQTSHPPAPGS